MGSSLKTVNGKQTKNKYQQISTVLVYILCPTQVYVGFKCQNPFFLKKLKEQGIYKLYSQGQVGWLPTGPA